MEYHAFKVGNLLIYYHEAKMKDIAESSDACDKIIDRIFLKSRIYKHDLESFLNSLLHDSVVIIDRFTSTGNLLIIDQESMQKFVEFVGKEKVILYSYRFPNIDDCYKFKSEYEFEYHYTADIIQIATSLNAAEFENVSNVFEFDDVLLFVYKNEITKSVINLSAERAALSAFFDHANKIYKESLNNSRSEFININISRRKENEIKSY